ncbi:MAG: M3 family metallopeptidase [Paludibacter sp.]|nr:M3 family metallopeptidase [Paludibacter sp.]MDD4199307.1 M3 family metallopeptidase [Paludibacter sp.]MDD4427515.1 M3 family metallopeptidase [Paludibacter sp.]
MKHIIFQQTLLIYIMSMIVTASMANPLLSKYKTPYETIPFNSIETNHYFPAFEEAMKIHRAEVDKIIQNKQKPTFENTIVALEQAGTLLNQVSSPFYNLLSAETNDELQQIAEKISPLMSEHSNAIRLNEQLFARVKAVYEMRGQLKLNTEEARLLQKTYDGFADNGANLSETDKAVYRELSKELSMLTLQFGQNVLKETNNWSLLITDIGLLKGLPEDVLDMLALNAKNAGKEGWILNLKATTYIPFMKYAENRDLRRELYLAYNTRCMNGGEFDNREIIKKIVNTRIKIANLLGHKSYADQVLVHRMAENKENVYKLLDELLKAYYPYAVKEVEEVQTYANNKGAYFKIQPWDWSYYSDKLKDEKYAVNDELLKPYFELENVKKGVFGLATKLYGIQFIKNDKIQKYHPEVDVYEVKDKNGKFLSVLYADFHPRDGKRPGAWMSEFKSQWKEKGKDSRPHIIIVMNFTRPTGTKPALLAYEELTTFLHEFGHALHGMLTECTYESLSGTNVYQDFVELPSQILENWASKKEFLDEFAVHYETGEKIPVELINKIKASENFNAAYFCLRQLSFGYLDMAWHTLESPFEGDVTTMEKFAMEKTQLLPYVSNTAMSPAFSHIFSGGYAAGYYSYKWAEVLDADAFSVFTEKGIFDQPTATSFFENILKRGGTEHPMVLYKRFRGQEPTIEALLKRSGVETR